MKDRLLFLLKVLISLGLIFYLFTRVELGKVAGAIGSANYLYLLLALVLYFLAIGLNVAKWRLLLQAQGLSVPFLGLVRHTLVGLFFANLPLAMVAGDIARGYDLARHVSGRQAEVAVSVVVDRLVGLSSFIVAATVMLAYAVFELGRADLTWLLITVAVVLLLFAAGFAVLLSRRLRGLVGRLFGWGPVARFGGLYRSLSSAVQVYRAGAGVLVVALIIALLGVLTTTVVNWLAANAVQAGIPFLWILVFNPLTPIAQFIPSIASGLGVNQGVFVGLYSAIGGVASPDGALAMSLVMQVIIYLASLPGGVLWWRKRGVASPAMETEEAWEREVSG
ncbi:MAG: lysylphosphatidylglycerol synthase transmembrane domain-containing protein [Anaerolineae bacterium]